MHCWLSYPIFSSVLNVESSESDVSEIEVTPDVEAADDVVDDDVDFRLVRFLLLSFDDLLLDLHDLRLDDARSRLQHGRTHNRRHPRLGFPRKTFRLLFLKT